MQVGPTTRPEPSFVEELNGAALTQLPLVVDLTEGEGTASTRMARQASLSTQEDNSHEGSESSESTIPLGEPIQSRQCGRSRLIWINGLLVYRMSNIKMVDCVKGRLVYMVDFFNTTVTPQYLESL